MFGFIKNFFNAIIGFITGFFGSKKSQDNQLQPAKPKKGGGYYMQLEESENQEPKAAAKSTASKSDAPEPSTKAKPQPAAAKAEPAPKAEPVAAKAEPAPTKAEKTPETAPNPQTVRVELVQGAEGLKAEPVKQPVTTAANNGKPASKTFATDYLIQPSTSAPRRRPGANMSSYLDMARQVKTPS